MRRRDSRFPNAIQILVGLAFLSPVAAPAEPPNSDHADLSYVHDADGQRRPIRTREDWQRRREQIRSGVERVMGTFPESLDDTPPQITTVEEARLDGLIRRKIEYRTDHTPTKVRAWLFLPTADDAPRAAVLCLHQTVAIGKDEPAGLGGNPNLHYAIELAREGFVTLAPDYPSFGEYPYDFSAEHGYVSGSMKAIVDNHRAVDVLCSLKEVDPERIGVIGHSLGGHNAIFTAFFDERLRAVVSCCGFTRFHRYYGGRLKGWTSDRYMPHIRTEFDNDPDRVPFDFPELIAGLAPRAFLAVAPERDSNFDVLGVRETIAAARPIYELHSAGDRLQAIYPDAGHDFPPEARRTAYRFLKEQLEPRRSPVE